MLPVNPPTGDPEQVSELLAEWNSGNRDALEKLVPLIYDELKRQARRHLRHERANHTLETSAIVHEAYIKLAEQRDVIWENRAHFFWLASEIMRRVLVDYARGRNRKKRGAGAEMISLDTGLAAGVRPGTDLLELDDALKKLEEKDRQQAKVVELRYFAGLNVSETAEALGVSEATVKRDWAAAKAWLGRELGPGK
ncbi:MAG: sigma-70 family RNA polymerase sigma factor [Chloracidobacterium sp.]|nr:sigma-70 family RNA polymerase sigma factor [Chloracidobacterium sp.]